MSADIHDLKDKPEYLEACAAWAFGEWGCHGAAPSFEKAYSSYQGSINAAGTNLPKTWIKLEGHHIAGMISLRDEDHANRADLSPWLASLYIHPYFRGRDYASALINHTEQKAHDYGHSTLYLQTTDTEKLYLKHDWEIMDYRPDSQGLGRDVFLMQKRLVH